MLQAVAASLLPLQPPAVLERIVEPPPFSSLDAHFRRTSDLEGVRHFQALQRLVVTRVTDSLQEKIIQK
jgi:hypothetical protein